MALVPSTGTISYNGYTFGVQTETQSIRGTPRMDKSGRTVAFMIWDITIRTIINTTPPLTTDGSLAAIRRQLTAQGGAFIYSNKGFGDLRVNVAGEQSKDVMWGPKCTGFSATPKGDRFAWEVIWSIQIATPDCSNAVFEGKIMEYSYSLQYSIDRSGYERRVHTGSFRIPQTRKNQGDRFLRDTADSYRADIYPAPIPGFRRTEQSYNLSDDKCEISFSIADEEMPPNIPPPNVIEVSASHKLNNSAPMKFAEWLGSISATYEMVKGASGAEALARFFELVEHRRQIITKTAGYKFFAILTFSAEEPEIYGKRTANFTVTFRSVSNLQGYFTGGLWSGVPGNNWAKWQASVSRWLYSPYGNAGLQFNPNQEVIIDLCSQQETRVLRGANFALQGPIGQLQTILGAGVPSPENSWMEYQNAIYIELMDGTILHQPLLTSKINMPAQVSGDQQFKQIGYQPTVIPQAPTSIIQQRSASSYYVYMIGRAIRSTYEIPAPVLESVGGVPASPANIAGCGFWQQTIGNNGLPIYAAQWKLRYLLPQGPKTTVSPPLNPIIDTSQQRALKGGG